MKKCLEPKCPPIKEKLLSFMDVITQANPLSRMPSVYNIPFEGCPQSLIQSGMLSAELCGCEPTAAQLFITTEDRIKQPVWEVSERLSNHIMNERR